MEQRLNVPQFADPSTSICRNQPLWVRLVKIHPAPP